MTSEVIKVQEFYKINVENEMLSKVLATGFVNGERSVFAVFERKRKLEIFPGMIGSFSVPMGSVKEKKFVDFIK